MTERVRQNLRQMYKDNSVSTIKPHLDWIGQSTKTIESKCKDLLNQSKTAGKCIFPLTNPHSDQSRDFVSDENIDKNLEQLCIWRGNLK